VLALVLSLGIGIACVMLIATSITRPLHDAIELGYSGAS
jgi:hypothetical protein